MKKINKDVIELFSKVFAMNLANQNRFKKEMGRNMNERELEFNSIIHSNMILSHFGLPVQKISFEEFLKENK
ncbi:hypothetical protein [Sulfurospirillum oryzae]|uniref:hypothetical protein n=1 Tax=Sulfurospirillum oryzae TaxID=2976535 RepID=UPI0021E76061|nr:hypothetical protein [Sulfurospirillum oryzae]